MATAKTKRVPVTERGIALLSLIAASTVPSAGVLMLTQDEAGEAVNAGYATVDQSVVDGDTAAVSLTDAGRAALTAGENTATGAAASSGYEIETGWTPPAKGPRRGRAGGYPFDALPVGGNFHVALKPDDKPEDLLTRLSSSVSGARAKYAEETGEMETVTVKTYKKDEGGKFIKDENGKRVVESEAKEERPKTRLTRDFEAYIVGEDDPKGAGVRIIRTA